MHIPVIFQNTHIDNADERPCGFLDWLVVLFVVMNARVIVLNSLIGVPPSVLVGGGGESGGCGRCCRRKEETHIGGRDLDVTDVGLNDLLVVAYRLCYIASCTVRPQKRRREHTEEYDMDSLTVKLLSKTMTRLTRAVVGVVDHHLTTACKEVPDKPLAPIGDLLP